jgi:Tol biopolymer transport system component
VTVILPAKRWGVLMLFLLVAALAVLSGSASAEIPPPPNPEDSVVYPQPDGFTWWMEARFGPDADADGIVDYHYETSWVRATEFKVSFNGCLTADERVRSNTGSTLSQYKFTITDSSGAVVGAAAFSNQCRIDRQLAQGAYAVRLDVQPPSGTAPGPWTQTVTVKDHLIVSIGDSYGSGEGNPDIPRVWGYEYSGGEWRRVVKTEARWVDKRCHRSATAGPAQAALDLEYSDPHSSVTFFSLACSGATINTPDPDKPENGTGLLGPYIGAEPGANPDPPMLPPQVDRLKEIVGTTGATGSRTIDALVISIGGNDMQFVKIIMECTLAIDCYDRAKHPAIVQRLDSRRGELPERYDDLARALQSVPTRNVYITEYPNLTLQDNGALCGTNSTWWNEPLMLGVTQPEVRWMYNDLLVPMNREIMPAAAGRHGWTFVGGVMNPFGILGQPPGYGYCANDTWLRRSSESVEMQGPNNRLETKGLLHPNAIGHQVYRQRIFAAITGASALEGPTYTTSLSALGSTSTVSNGWITGRCDDSTGRCSSGGAVMKLTITDPDGVANTNTFVNGQAGCAYGRRIDANTYQWEFTSDIRYADNSVKCFGRLAITQIRAVATDGAGNTSTHTFEAKIDRSSPLAQATAARAPLVDGYYGAPVDVVLTGEDCRSVACSGVSHIRYQVDDGPWQDIKDSGAVNIAMDGTHVIRYHAMDFAGRESGRPFHPEDPAVPEDLPITIRMDRKAPVTSAITTPIRNAAGWHKEDVAVELVANDGAGAGVEQITYSATGAQQIASTTAPGSLAEVRITAPGTTTITYTARDRVGNAAAARTVVVNLDKTVPSAALGAPASGAVYRTGTITLSGTASDPLSGLALVEFLVDDVVVNTDTTAPYSYALDSAIIPDGIRRGAIRATDRAGNVRTSERVIYVNRTSNTYLRSRPARTTTSTSASFTFSAWDTGSTYECSLDGAAFAACTSPKSYSGLAVRNHTFTVRAKSPSGVLDATPASYTWMIQPPPAARTTLASVSPSSAVSNSGEAPAASTSGRFVAFQDSAALAAGDTNGMIDIYVRDRDTDRDGIFDEAGAMKTVRVSVRNDGVQTNNHSSRPSISGDGRFVSFRSLATNLVDGDTNGFADIFLHDRDTDADGVYDETGAVSTRRVSVSETGAQSNAHSENPSVSANGRYIAFDSYAGTLVPGDTGYFDAFVFDRIAGTLKRMSVTSTGAQGLGQSSRPAMSADGRFVAFLSNARNLTGTTHHMDDIYVRDRDTDRDRVFDEPGQVAIVKMSLSTAGGAPDGYVTHRPAISSTGRFVAFTSNARNLVPGDTNGQADVFMRDRDTDRDGIFDETGATSLVRVSVSSTGAQADRASTEVSITGDGRSVAFESSATTLAPGATSGFSQIFLRDLKGRTTRLGSVTSTGAQGSLRSFLPALSESGGYLVYVSDSVNMTPDDATSDRDIFTSKLETVPPDTAILTGPKFFTTATTASFTWSATEAGVTYTCSLDYGPYGLCVGPKSYSGLRAGVHVFQVRATDASGNTDPTPAEREWTVRP